MIELVGARDWHTITKDALNNFYGCITTFLPTEGVGAFSLLMR